MLDAVRQMPYLDADQAVREVLAQKIKALEFTSPDGKRAVKIRDVFTTWPTAPKRSDLPGIFIEPGKVGEPDYLGDEIVIVEGSEDAIVKGMVTRDFGPVIAPFIITGIALDKDDRDIIFRILKMAMRDEEFLVVEECDDYFGQRIVLQMESSARLEAQKYAERGVRAFEIEGFGETNEVGLVEPDRRTIKADVEFE